MAASRRELPARVYAARPPAVAVESRATATSSSVSERPPAGIRGPAGKCLLRDATSSSTRAASDDMECAPAAAPALWRCWLNCREQCLIQQQRQTQFPGLASRRAVPPQCQLEDTRPRPATFRWLRACEGR